MHQFCLIKSYCDLGTFFFLSTFKVCDNCPVRKPKDHLLLTVGAEVYNVSPDPDALLPYLIKDNPLLPVVHNHRIKIEVDAQGWTESTALVSVF